MNTNSSNNCNSSSSNIDLFSSNDKILSSLIDTHKTQQLTSWLASTQTCIDKKCYRCCCQKERVSAAYCILNSIRDGCQQILEREMNNVTFDTCNNVANNKVDSHNNGNAKTSIDTSININSSRKQQNRNKNTNFSKNDENYESSFPSLGSTGTGISTSSTTNSNNNNNTVNVLKAKKKKQNNKKQSQSNSITITSNGNDNTSTTKRRIRPISSSTSTTTNIMTSTHFTRANDLDNDHDNNSNQNNTIHTSISKISNNENLSSTTSSINTTSIASNNNMTSPWNQLFHQKKTDPMDRIMNTKHIISHKRIIITDTNIGATTTAPSNVNIHNNDNDVHELPVMNSNDVMIEKTKNPIATDIHTSNTLLTRIHSSCINQNETISEEKRESKQQKQIIEQQQQIQQQSKLDNTQQHHEHNHKNDDDHDSSTSPLFDNMIQVYYTIITNLLIPSMMLELQLILRLLSLNTQSVESTRSTITTTTRSDDVDHKVDVDINNNHNPNPIINTTTTATIDATTIESKIQQLFSTKSKCQHFAIAILIKLKPILFNLSKDIKISLLRLPSVQYYLPKQIIQDLHDCIEARNQFHGVDGNNIIHNIHNYNEGNGKYGNGLGYSGDISSTGGGGLMLGSPKSMILNVSFDEKRDSRHYFKSRDLGTLYNNREQCRGK